MSESKLNAEESIRETGTPKDLRNQSQQLIDLIEQAQRSLATTRTRRRRLSGAHQGQLAMQEANASDKFERLYMERGLQRTGRQCLRLSGIPELRR
ncbi:hypothetical protein BDW67DRAFT_151759 [Aspergillus spinulosporus]